VLNWDKPDHWYEVMNPWGPSDRFYFDLVMLADRVLDVGCGTGILLRRARDAGHKGRLCGLEPNPDMLEQAQVRTDINWVLADAASAAWDGEFDLAVMTSHAFQELVTDDEIRRSLRAIRAALAGGGRFAFETRHPQARAWEGWNSSFEVTSPAGETITVTHQVLDVTAGVVAMTESLSGARWNEPQTGRGTLRFIDGDTLTGFLEEAGFAVEEQFGDWARGPITADSKEIITIARRVG
jgi:SAM-dependent methyltransferase